MTSFYDDNQADIFEALISTSRYLYDLLDIENTIITILYY